MKKTYPNLLSPLVLNGSVLKNRVGFPVAPVHFLVGPETYPNDAYITFHANLAKAGCAWIHLSEWNNKLQRTVGLADSLHMPMFDTDDPAVWNYICQLNDAIHFYGSKASMAANFKYPEGYTLTGGMAGPGFPGMRATTPTKPLPESMMDDVIGDWIEYMRQYKLAGVDMTSTMFTFSSNPGNQRDDEYGNQTLENRTRFQRRALTALKKELGRSFLVETIVAGETDAYTTEDLIEVAGLFEGLIDIYTLRERDVVASHPTGFTFAQIGDHKVTGYAKKMKDAGVKAAIGINGGFQDLDECEGYLADGVCDTISIARGIFADPEWLKKAKEGRGEDVTPCIWCNKCHGVGFKGPWLVFCSVNPEFGIESKVKRLVEPVERVKKVAVIGGGPVGMRAALYTAKRGHAVTLFEKADHLGGQLDYADHFSFKWPIRDHRDWLIRQVGKSAIDVRLNCAPKPEALEQANYDVIIAAVGALNNIPKNIQGLTKADGSLADHVYTISSMLGHEAEMGQKIVVVGASESGIEAAIHLAQQGKDVWALTRKGDIAPDANHPQYITMTWIDHGPNASPMGTSPEWLRYDNLTSLTQATTTSVEGGVVTYTDAEGAEHQLAYDSVVMSGGMNRNVDGALAYASAAPDFYMIGDCSEHGGDLRRGYREAWATANQI